MHVTLEVSPVDILIGLSSDSKDPDFLNAISSAKDKVRGTQLNFITENLIIMAIILFFIFDKVENEFNTKVISSNQAIIWDCLRILKIDNDIIGYGNLFKF